MWNLCSSNIVRKLICHYFRECINKFREKLAADVWTAINNVFDVMPIAGVIDNRV